MDQPPNFEDYCAAIQSHPEITVRVPVPMLMSIIGFAQLGMRHPNAPEASARLTREFVRQVKATLPPVLQTVIDMGANPVFDISADNLKSVKGS